MNLRPVTRDQLREFVRLHHRHTKPPRQAIVKVGVEVDGVLIGVGCGAAPVARALDDGVTIEISRVCLAPGDWPNACSRIYGALCRAAAAQGFRRVITYTLMSEPGSSVRGSGFVAVAETRARSWPSERRAQLSLVVVEGSDVVSAPRRRWSKAV